MKKITVISGLALALVLPAGAAAAPQPDNADKRAAKAECKTLRGGTDATREAFLTLYRSFGACVSAKAREEAREEKTAHTNAAWECKEERDGNVGPFNDTYGKNANDRNAFGKCVSEKAKAKEAAADERDQQQAKAFKKAAKSCAAEREAGAQAFRTTYGTENVNYKNAFGKCVSRKARENDTA
jgi:hypothetical protein